MAHLTSSRSEFENRVVLFLHASSGISAAASPSGASFLVSSLHCDQHDPRDDRERQQMAPPDRIGVVLIANGARSSRISRTGGLLSTVLYWRYSVVPAAKSSMSVVTTERKPITVCRERAWSSPVISPVTPRPNKGHPAQAASGGVPSSGPAPVGAIASLRGRARRVVTEGSGRAGGLSPRRSP